MHNVSQIASEIGRQFARLARSLAQADFPRDAAAGELRPPFGNLEISDWVRAMELWRRHGAALIPSQPPRGCPACGGTDHRFLFNSFDSYPYVDCLGCGTWYVPLVVDDELFERYYESCAEAREIVERLAAQRLDQGKADADQARMSTYLAELEALLRPELRDMLDVGCGVGHSLEVAVSRGWHASGIDSSPRLIEAARARGRDVRHRDDVLERKGFGLISLWETLEHINDPFKLLSDLVPLLHDDGIVSITVPNVLAVEARVMRQDLAWINGGAIGTVHINLFHRASLERLLNRAGLAIAAVDGEFGFNSYEMASYLLGRHRGAWDYSHGMRVEQNLPEDAVSFLNWVGPAWTVLARQLLLTPIIKIVACKREDPRRTARFGDLYVEARRREIVAQLDTAYPE